MTTTALRAVDPDALDPAVLEGMALVARAEAVKIITPANLAEAAEARRLLKTWLDERTAHYAPLKRAARQPWQEIIDAEKAELETPQAVFSVINRAMTEYEANRRREQAILEARAAQEAKETGAIVPAPLAAPKAPGVAFVAHWTVTVDDKLALVKAVAQGWGSPDLFEVDLGWLQTFAKQYKGTVKIPGCTIKEDPRPR